VLFYQVFHLSPLRCTITELKKYLRGCVSLKNLNLKTELGDTLKTSVRISYKNSASVKVPGQYGCSLHGVLPPHTSHLRNLLQHGIICIWHARSYKEGSQPYLSLRQAVAGLSSIKIKFLTHFYNIAIKQSVIMLDSGLFVICELSL
jgi:hypothetical protein